MCFYIYIYIVYTLVNIISLLRYHVFLYVDTVSCNGFFLNVSACLYCIDGKDTMKIMPDHLSFVLTLVVGSSIMVVMQPAVSWVISLVIAN